MNRLQTVGLLMVLTAVLAVTLGVPSAETVTGDRAVSVAVADDDTAFIAYETADSKGVSAGERLELVAITNRFPTDISVIDVDVRVVETSNIILTDITKPDINSGEQDELTGRVNQCHNGDSASIQVSVTIEGENTATELSGDPTTREFTVDCAGSSNNSGEAVVTSGSS